jgi:hypothetical protein
VLCPGPRDYPRKRFLNIEVDPFDYSPLDIH